MAYIGDIRYAGSNGGLGKGDLVRDSIPAIDIIDEGLVISNF